MLTKLIDTGIAIFESIFGLFIDGFSSVFTKICDFLKTDKNTLLRSSFFTTYSLSCSRWVCRGYAYDFYRYTGYIIGQQQKCLLQ